MEATEIEVVATEVVATDFKVVATDFEVVATDFEVFATETGVIATEIEAVATEEVEVVAGVVATEEALLGWQKSFPPPVSKPPGGVQVHPVTFKDTQTFLIQRVPHISRTNCIVL